MRAKSHLFAATPTPTGNNTFDVEYVLQIEIGGATPQFLTTPFIIKTVKALFTVNVATVEFADVGGVVRNSLEEKFSQDNQKFEGLLGRCSNEQFDGTLSTISVIPEMQYVRLLHDQSILTQLAMCWKYLQQSKHLVQK